MAWFRAGGGGIPSSLKGDMNDVFNKKFGTTLQDYPPDDWPGTVNLMGPLPEKTVSGSVVAFSDGADAVKLKSCAVTIAPNLVGVSSVDVVQMGKNLCNPSDVGNYAISGTDGSVATNANSLATYNKIPVGSNTEISVSCGDYCDVRGIYCYGANDSFLGRPGVLGETNQMTRTLATGTTHIRVTFRKHGGGAVSPSDLTSAQIEFGSSSTTYLPYVSTTHTANLGRTIYGGSVDVVAGTGTETAGKAVFTGSETWQLYSNETFWYTTLQADNIKVQQNCTTSNGVVVRYQSTSGQLRVYISQNVGVVDTQTDMNALLSNGVSFAYPYETPETFTFTPVPVNSLLDDNTLWSEDGDLEVVYRSTGTETIIQPTLVTKSITENGTYNAASDNADGYSSVTVNVSGGGGNTPQATQTLICDNSALGSSLTFTDDYENYDLIKFVVYRSDIGNQFTFYMTPAMINAMAQYSSNRINFNQPYGNNFVCYTKTSNTAWTRYGVRNLTVKYVYGLTFTNCTVTETELYNRQGIGSSNVTFTPPTGETFFDYDYILLATCTGNSDETQVNLDVFQPDIEKDIFGSDNADENSVRVYKYNQGGTFVTVTENTITSFSYFYVCGLKLSYNQQNLLGGFNSNSEPEIESENSNDNEEDPINE